MRNDRTQATHHSNIGGSSFVAFTQKSTTTVGAVVRRLGAVDSGALDAISVPYVFITGSGALDSGALDVSRCPISAPEGSTTAAGGIPVVTGTKGASALDNGTLDASICSVSVPHVFITGAGALGRSALDVYRCSISVTEGSVARGEIIVAAWRMGCAERWLVRRRLLFGLVHSSVTRVDVGVCSSQPGAAKVGVGARATPSSMTAASSCSFI